MIRIRSAMPEAIMADPARATFMDANIQLYSRKLNRTREFITQENEQLQKGVRGRRFEALSTEVTAFTAVGLSRKSENAGRLQSSSDAFFNTPSTQHSPEGPKRSWAIVEVKDLKLSNQIRDNTNPRQKTDLVSRSMVTFDRGSPTNAGNNSRRHQNSHHNNQNKTTNSAYDVHQSKYFRTNHNQQIQSGANIVKPIIKGFNTNSSMKSASTNELHVQLPSSQSTTSFPNAPNRRISSAMGRRRVRRVASVMDNNSRQRFCGAPVRQSITPSPYIHHSLHPDDRKQLFVSNSRVLRSKSISHMDETGSHVSSVNLTASKAPSKHPGQPSSIAEWSDVFDEVHLDSEVFVRPPSSINGPSTEQAQERIEKAFDVNKATPRKDQPSSSPNSSNLLSPPSYRDRSQSPAEYTPRYKSSTYRSRSLSSRRVDTGLNRNLLPPSGRVNNRSNSKDRSTQDNSERTRGGSNSRINSISSSNNNSNETTNVYGRSRVRRSSLPFNKWKQQKQQQSSNPDLGANSSEGMNGESLPPINSNRSESALSKKSSKGSSAGSLTKGAVFKYDKAPLISIDDQGPVKRSHLSPGSQNSGSSGNSKGGSKGLTSGQTLETLFEQKNTATASGANTHNTVEESAIDSGYNSYKQVNGYINKTMKHPTKEGRRGSLASNTVFNTNNGKLSALNNKRTQSISNITNISGTSGNSIKDGTSNNRLPLTRNRSENLLSIAISTGQSDRSTTPKNMANGRQPNLRSQKKSGFTRTASQPLLSSLDRGCETELNASNLKKRHSSNRETNNNLSKTAIIHENDDGSDGERNDRIVQWLIGVDQGAEPPPTPDIAEDEEPLQTDTAIHVVYGET